MIASTAARALAALRTLAAVPALATPRALAVARALAAACVLATFALPALAGGPLKVLNQQPVVYPDGGTSIRLNPDQGPLGNRSNAQAIAIVQNAIAMWNAVTTSTLRLSIGPALSSDYTAANYSAISQNYADGINPVVFDTDGSITDLVFGAGARSTIAGFAGSSYYTSGPLSGTYIEGRAVLNGSLNITDATLANVLAHEIGHFVGLSHAQLDATQGLASSNFVLMYPIAYRTQPTLHEDDAAAVTALYPAASATATYGQLSGTFTTVAGTPIQGANIWAKETTTGKVYSIVSDYLVQGTGYFQLSLPAGTYTLHAESIATNFTGGSGVGPFTGSASGASFTAPHPIAPVALGGGTPQQIAILAGCAATATFRLDGAGNVGGNCIPPPPPPPPPPASLLTLITRGSGTGAIVSDPVAGTTNVLLTATPALGSSFIGWLGACTGTQPCVVNSAVAATVSATFAPAGVLPRIDIDGNGSCSALTDGLLIIRYLFGLTGSPLSNGAIGAGATRTSPAALVQQLDNIKPLLDVDGNGQVTALTDGIMLTRYLFGLRGAALTNGAMGAGATRTTAQQIETWIRSLMP